MHSISNWKALNISLDGYMKITIELGGCTEVILRCDKLTIIESIRMDTSVEFSGRGEKVHRSRFDWIKHKERKNGIRYRYYRRFSIITVQSVLQIWKQVWM